MKIYSLILELLNRFVRRNGLFKNFLLYMLFILITLLVGGTTVSFSEPEVNPEDTSAESTASEEDSVSKPQPEPEAKPQPEPDADSETQTDCSIDNKEKSTLLLTIFGETEDAPIRGARVFVTPKDCPEEKTTSNRKGKAEIHVIPGSVKIQIIADGWKTFGDKLDIKDKEKEILVQLKRKSRPQ